MTTSLKVATWNVNSVKVRVPHLVQWIEKAQPDVLLLQEIKCVDDAFPIEAFDHLGYNIETWGQKTYNGVAILSKYPIEDITRGLPGNEEDPQARYIEAFTGGVRVASVYVPNGQEVGSEKFAYKCSFLNHLQAHMEKLLHFDEPIIIGGDYNIAPYPTDGHNPETFLKDRILCSLQEREKLRSIVNLGYIDAFRLQHPDHLSNNQKCFSWWDYRAGSWESNKGYRIDHLLISPQAADLMQDAGIDDTPRGWPKPSDHAPVWGAFAQPQ